MKGGFEQVLERMVELEERLDQSGELTAETRSQLELHRQAFNLHFSLLINEAGEFHPSSEKTQTFSVSDPMVARLRNILSHKKQKVASALCTPVHRDVVVFYDHDGNVLSLLHACFSCLNLARQRGDDIVADYQVYPLLAEWFRDCGHGIQETDWSLPLSLRDDNTRCSWRSSSNLPNPGHF